MKLTVAQLLVGKWLEEWGYCPVYEQRVCADRNWRFDVAVPELRIAIECNGHFRGRHGAGWSKDSDKTNHAQMQGWRVLTFSNQDVLRGTCAYEFLREHLGPATHQTLEQ